MKRPMTCPICGNKISRITNATTGNSYFKCSNKDCFFVLSENYTDADFYLQGTPLKSRCLKCGKPLKVASGPYGLYPRCFSCDCDTAPFKINGRIFQKWANARREDAKAEVVALEEEFNSKNEDDQLYDFEEFIANAEPKVKETKPKKKEKKTSTNNEMILGLLRANLKSPLSAEEISRITGIHIGSTRAAILSLRSLEEVKIAGASENYGNYTLLYQVKESPLPELTVYSKKDGYNSIASFLKENIDKYGSIVRTREVLMAALKSANIEPSLFQNTRGICCGYKISVMEKLMNSKNSSKEEVEKVNVAPASRNEVRDGIMRILQRNLNKPCTIKELAQELRSNKVCVRSIIKALRDSKKVKIVGWEQKEGYPGATALSYQLMESSLPKFKVTVDNNAYLTFKQFYNRKLKGRKCTSVKKAEQIIKNLPVTPLIINQRAYAGYAVSDLKEAFNEYLDSPASKKTSSKYHPVEISTVEIPVSNPIAKKKSVFSFFSSLFKSKEKVHS